MKIKGKEQVGVSSYARIKNMLSLWYIFMSEDQNFKDRRPFKLYFIFHWMHI